MKILANVDRTCFLCGFWVPKAESAMNHHPECVESIEQDYPALWADALSVDFDLVWDILNPMVPVPTLIERYREALLTVELADDAKAELTRLYNHALNRRNL